VFPLLWPVLLDALDAFPDPDDDVNPPTPPVETLFP